MGDWGLRRLIAATLLCAVGGVDAAQAAMATSAVQAIVIKPLSLLKTRDLDFGTIGTTAAAGTITIDADTDAASGTGGAVPGGRSQAAQFLTFGGPRQNIVINRGALPMLNRVGGGATMAVTGLTLNGPVNRFLNSAGVLDLRVGGTITVAANQQAGSYSGTFQIVVTYF